PRAAPRRAHGRDSAGGRVRRSVHRAASPERCRLSPEREEANVTTRSAAETALAQLEIGRRVTVRKTVSETDVYLFAGISGDFSPNHVDEEFMKETRYGRRIAHGALLVAYMSQASTKMCQSLPGTVVSYGYDRIRFPGPVFIGDTVTVAYEIESLDLPTRKAFSRVTVTNQRGEVVAAGVHVLKWVEG